MPVLGDRSRGLLLSVEILPWEYPPCQDDGYREEAVRPQFYTCFLSYVVTACRPGWRPPVLAEGLLVSRGEVIFIARGYRRLRPRDLYFIPLGVEFSKILSQHTYAYMFGVRPYLPQEDAVGFARVTHI